MDKKKAIGFIRTAATAYINHNVKSKEVPDAVKTMNDLIAFVETQCIASVRDAHKTKEKNGGFDKATNI